jgi:anti-sigma regulatory factor (Ser/Thr protein kinase)
MAQVAEGCIPSAGWSAPAPVAVRHPGRAHAAALVGSDQELLDSTVPFLDEGLRAGDLVVLSCPPDTAALLAAALGERAGTVESDTRLCLLDTTVPDAITATSQLVHRARGSDSGRLRVAGQVQFGPEPRNWREGLRYEAAANVLLADQPVSAMCLFDRRVLPEEVLAGAAATHPELRTGDRAQPSGAFLDPVEFVRRLPLPREPVEESAPVLAVDDAVSLPDLRRALRTVIEAWVHDPDRAADLHLAASEIVSNAFRHGARPVSARVWADGAHLVCAISDRGEGFDGPFAGFRPAHGMDLSRGGMGLWLARKLWDHVDLLPGAAQFTVRLSARLR